MTPEQFYEKERYPVMKDKHSKHMHTFTYHDMMQFGESYAKIAFSAGQLSVNTQYGEFEQTFAEWQQEQPDAVSTGPMSGLPCDFDINNTDKVIPV